MARRNLIGLTIILAVSAACATDGILAPSVGFEHAVITPACGPADGPAVAIYLSSNPVDPRNPSIPYVRIALWDAPDVVQGRSWGIGDASGMATAVLVRGANQYDVATAGSVSIGLIDTTSTTTGSAELVFSSVGLVSGEFRASWSAAAPLCG